MRILRSFSKTYALLAWLVWISGGATLAAAPEDFLVQTWGTDEGLPHSTVTSIAQTPDGYLWVGTEHGGLARFDGQRFVNFHPGNTPELRSIEVRKLLVDSRGTLWIGTVEGAITSYREGRFRFELQNTETPAAWLGQVLSVNADGVVLASRNGWLFEGTTHSGVYRWEARPLPDANSGSTACRDREGNIWYRASSGGLVQVRGKTFVSMPHPPGLSSPLISAVLVDDAGQLWVGTDQELARWDGEKFINQTPTNGEAKLNVQQLAACSDGSVWVLSDQALRKCRDQRWVTPAAGWAGDVLQSSRFPVALSADSRGGVWVWHYADGLWHVDANGQTSRVKETHGLPNTLFRCWFEDREGNVWMGLNGGGLVCLRARTFHPVWPAAGQAQLAASSISEDASGAMWFGTSETKLLRWSQGELATFVPPFPQSLGVGASVLADDRGRVWAGFVVHGVVTLENGEFTFPFPASAINSVARVIYQDRAGRVWLGSEFGLYCWDGEKLKHFSTADGFSPAYVLAITEDRAGALWIGTAVGELRRYREGKFTKYLPLDSPLGPPRELSDTDARDKKNRGALSGGERFWALHADADGVIWIGSLGGGLLRFQDGRFTRYTPREGLPNDYISQILEDERGQLWLGSQGGIARVSKAALNQFARGETKFARFVTYGKTDGMPTAECSGGCQPACWRSRDGRLWFATRKGAVWTDPTEVRFNPVPPPVVIEEVSVDGRRVGEDGQAAGHFAATPPARLTVPPGRHYLEFKFTAPSLTAPDRVRFKWRLDGLEKQWTRESDQRSVSYSFVPPGDYTFQVQACNSDGVWNEIGASLPLTMRPYFWQTRWFPLVVMAFSILGTAALVVLVLRTRHRRKLARLEVLRATELERSRIARDLHDELGSGLTEVTMLTAAIPGAELTPEKLRAKLQRAGARAHELVEALDEIVWAVDPAKDNLPALAKYFAGYVEEYLKESHIACLVQMPATFPDVPIAAEVRHQLFLAVRETVSNAVRHGRPGRIGFAVAFTGERRLWIVITDDGCGFDSAAVASGNGLANLQTRLASVGGQCEIVSRPGGGTTVKLVVGLPESI